MSNRTATAAVPQPMPGSGLKRFLYLTAALTGAAVMIVEILGARMLSPYVGTSHFVWVAQIAVTLVALAAGYYAGGRLADRTLRLHTLYWAILAAAAWLALTAVACEPVAYACLGLNLALGSLLASAALFFVPLGLLAMAAPFLIRALTASVAGVGGSVGRLTAVSTLGSFGGTLLIGYVLVPLMPNSVTMYATALTLMLLAVAYFAVFKRGAAAPAALLALVATAVAVASPLWGGLRKEYAVVVEQFRGNSHFGQLQVLDRKDAPVRYLLNDNLIQNAYDTERRQSTLAFTYLLTGLSEAYVPGIDEVLVIGMGIGIVPTHFSARGARVDTVEINPAVPPLAERFFGFDPSCQNLVLGDGRQFINSCRRAYDVVIVDAFVGDSSPSHLMTRETFLGVRRILRPGGAFVLHVFGQNEPGRDFLPAALKRTLASVFASVSVHFSGEGAFFFVSRNEPPPVELRPMDMAAVHPLARREVAAAFDATPPTVRDDGILLSDDYNPADYFDARNRETLRRQLALSASRM